MTNTTSRKMPTAQEIATKMIPVVRDMMAAGRSYTDAFAVAAHANADDINRACASTARGMWRMVQISCLVQSAVEA